MPTHPPGTEPFFPLEVPTHHHHVHEGADANVLPHGLISVEEVLAIIAAEAAE